MKEERRRRRLGFRSEASILLPSALLLLIALSTFTLVSYRSALTRLTEERRDEAARLAAAAAAALALAPGLPLQPLAPGARAIALIDLSAGGVRLLAASGEPPPSPMAAAAGRPVSQPFGVGPDDGSPDAVVGYAPVTAVTAVAAGAAGGGERVVRVELAAATLGGQRRAIGLLTALVAAVDSALLLIVFFFLRRLFAPYDTLLARARQAGELGGSGSGAGGESGVGGGGEGTDEIELLLNTFDRALEALAAVPAVPAPGPAGDDDISALERTLSASLQSGLLLLDREGKVLALNEVGSALLSVPPPRSGEALSAVLASQPDLLALLAAAVAEEREVKRQECTLRAAAGPAGVGVAGRITVGLTVHPLRRKGDRAVTGYLVLFADLTEARRQADENRLAESLAQLGEMAAGVAHELRNSLATLAGYLTLLERQPEPAAAAEYLGEMRTETATLRRVLDDFLAFARPGTARPRELSLGGLLRRAAADPALQDVAIERLGELADDGADLALLGDPELLARAFHNLLHNAAEAARAAGGSGPIEVRIDHLDDGIEVVIADRGPGVPRELLERLFHPFATARPGGVGLGLAVAQRVVHLHGGRLRLSDRPGGGTEARVWLPDGLLVRQNRYPS